MTHGLRQGSRHRVLLVDDERYARVALAGLLEERDDVTIVGEADSVKSAAEQIVACDPDVVFLDVVMWDGTGFDVFERVPVQSHVVFVTAHDDHALRAFEVNALDYLVKPVQPEHLDRALSRVSRALSTVPSRGAAEPAREAVAELRPEDPLCLELGKHMVFARVSEVVFLRADRDHTRVHLTSGRICVVRQPLSRWEARLPAQFARIHRSVLVNLDHLEELGRDADGWTVKLRSVDEPLRVSRRLVAGLRERTRG